ncbi:hypothetical protein BJY52DRAFT_808157 [Lactarius psammicola]|nr:hypothetical protein BJY52DRAFT_808157 [Lactarius psammicola]
MRACVAIFVLAAFAAGTGPVLSAPVVYVVFPLGLAIPADLLVTFAAPPACTPSLTLFPAMPPPPTNTTLYRRDVSQDPSHGGPFIIDTSNTPKRFTGKLFGRANFGAGTEGGGSDPAPTPKPLNLPKRITNNLFGRDSIGAGYGGGGGGSGPAPTPHP